MLNKKLTDLPKLSKIMLKSIIKQLKIKSHKMSNKSITNFHKQKSKLFKKLTKLLNKSLLTSHKLKSNSDKFLTLSLIKLKTT